MSNKRPVAIITGGASGIGAASAVHLARAGYNVAVGYRRNADGAAAVVDRCKAAGADSFSIQTDVSSDGDCISLAKSAVDRWAGIDAVVNSAGMTVNAEGSDLSALDAEMFHNIYAVNVIGGYQIIRASLPHLRQSSNGSVVNVSSYAAMTGLGSSLAYSASKGALNTLTLGLARALAPEVRVNAVCPGVVDTSWRLAWQSAEEYDRFKAEAVRLTPLKRIPDGDEIADAIGWLTVGARTITGQLLTIDGGTHLAIAAA